MSNVDISILILQMTKIKKKKKRGKGDGKREICGSCICMKFILYVKEKERVIRN